MRNIDYFNEFYESEKGGVLTSLYNEYFGIGLQKLLSDDPFELDMLQEVARQAIECNQKEIFDNYVGTILESKGLNENEGL